MRYSPFMLATAGVESIVAVLFAWYWKHRHNLSWGFFGWGAVALVAVVPVSGLVSGPIWNAASEFIRQTFPKHIARPLFRLCLDSLDSVLIVGAAFLFAAITRVRNADWKQAVAFGTGFRSPQVFLEAFWNLGRTLMELQGPPEGDMPSWAMSPLLLPPDSTWLWVAVGTVERVLISIVDISAVVLSVYAWRRKRWGYLVMCVLYMTVAEALNMFGMTSYDALEKPSRTWTVEAILVLIALLGYWSIAALRSKWENARSTPTTS